MKGSVLLAAKSPSAAATRPTNDAAATKDIPPPVPVPKQGETGAFDDAPKGEAAMKNGWLPWRQRTRSKVPPATRSVASSMPVAATKKRLRAACLVEGVRKKTQTQTRYFDEDDAHKKKIHHFELEIPFSHRMH